MTTKYVTTAELAAHFSVSSATIMAMMKSGEIPNGTYMRLGRVFRFDLEKIEQTLLTRGDIADDSEAPAPAVQYEFDFNDNTTDTAEEDGIEYYNLGEPT
jgi:predicted DNA-binding transcriptional regulator AlpA